MSQTSPGTVRQPVERSLGTAASGRPRQASAKDPLPWLLARQHGVISRQQAESIGLTESTICHRIRPGGPWQRLLPGIYLTVTGSATADQKDMAALLYAGRQSTITGLAALRRYGLTVPATRFIDVLVPPTCCRADRDYIRLHRTNKVPVRVGENAYIQIALIPRAAVDAALGMTSVRDMRALIAGVVQEGRCAVNELQSELGQSRLRNSAILRSVLAEVADGARSSPEADLMNLIKASGLPRPLYNPRLYVGKTFSLLPTSGGRSGASQSKWTRASGTCRPKPGRAR